MTVATPIVEIGEMIRTEKIIAMIEPIKIGCTDVVYMMTSPTKPEAERIYGKIAAPTKNVHR